MRKLSVFLVALLLALSAGFAVAQKTPDTVDIERIKTATVFIMRISLSFSWLRKNRAME